MKYTAIVRYNGNLKNITNNDYTSKQAFTKELRNNEYRVLGVFNELEIKHIINTDEIDLYLESKKGYNNTKEECIEYIKQILK